MRCAEISPGIESSISDPAPTAAMGSLSIHTQEEGQDRGGGQGEGHADKLSSHRHPGHIPAKRQRAGHARAAPSSRGPLTLGVLMGALGLVHGGAGQFMGRGGRRHGARPSWRWCENLAFVGRRPCWEAFSSLPPFCAFPLIRLSRAASISRAGEEPKQIG